jgi:hypothetical protein
MVVSSIGASNLALFSSPLFPNWFYYKLIVSYTYIVEFIEANAKKGWPNSGSEYEESSTKEYEVKALDCQTKTLT